MTIPTALIDSTLVGDGYDDERLLTAVYDLPIKLSEAHGGRLEISAKHSGDRREDRRAGQTVKDVRRLRRNAAMPLTGLAERLEERAAP